MKQIELTYKQIKELRESNEDVYVEDPQGYTKITNTFSKESTGYELILDDKSSIKCANGHRMLSNNDWINADNLEVGDYLTDKYGNNSKKIIKKTKVDNQKWIDFSVDNEFESYIQNGVIHHNSGKSYMIYIFFRWMIKNNNRSILVVPSISLTLQMKSDFISYGFKDFDKYIKVIGGEFNDKNLDTHHSCISTWQSLQHLPIEEFDKFNAIVVDEAQNCGDVLESIVRSTINAQWKVGVTGTIPKTLDKQKTIIGTLGRVYKVISPKGLIDRGLATPVKVNMIFLNYPFQDKEFLVVEKSKIKKEVNGSMKPDKTAQYRYEVDYVQSHFRRNDKVVTISSKLSEKNNTLILFLEQSHGRLLTQMAIKKKTGDNNIEILDKITPNAIKKAIESWKEDNTLVFYINQEINDENLKKMMRTITKALDKDTSLEFMKSIKSMADINIFFIYGGVEGVAREKVRLLLEERDGVQIFGSKGTVSTGINFKKLSHIILASSFKDFVGISQTIGRGMRLHPSKSVVHIWDIVDDLSKSKHRKNSLLKHSEDRMLIYLDNEYPISEKELHLV